MADNGLVRLKDREQANNTAMKFSPLQKEWIPNNRLIVHNKPIASELDPGKHPLLCLNLLRACPITCKSRVDVKI